MKQFNSGLLILLLALLLSSCKQGYEAGEQLDPVEQTAFKTRIIRYVAEMPKHATYENKFESRFDEQYLKEVNKTALTKYYSAGDGYIYFEVRKQAPSFKVKYNATGGRLKLDSTNRLQAYEEIYRTWKMEEGELNEKTNMLFDKMVKGKDLSPYYTDNSGDELIIEFPDKNIVYNSLERRWVNKTDLN